MKTLETLNAELAAAVALCERLSRPAHQVRNCPSDLQAEDAAWRLRQSLEFQIKQLTAKDD
jgi:hypothetical protein